MLIENFGNSQILLSISGFVELIPILKVFKEKDKSLHDFINRPATVISRTQKREFLSNKS